MFTHVALISRVFVCLSGVGGWGFALRALWPVLEPKWQRMIAMFILMDFWGNSWASALWAYAHTWATTQLTQPTRNPVD